jgi:hypothetical protein
MDTTNGEAIQWLADKLGFTGREPEEVDIITAVCRDKRMPVDAFKLFGVKEAKRGRDVSEVACVDV